jgi:murein DD-endopeptidase MepM/ murein hydrolase activator NlpD
MFQLLLPVRDVSVTQPFGVNYLDFYANLKMKGHNGIDFKARNGCPVLAAHGGIVSDCGTDSGGGNYVELDSAEGYRTIYYHLKSIGVSKGHGVSAGFVIGTADNTGVYTTGDHLHFGLKEIKNGATINKDNGYNGAIDPAPFFALRYGEFWYKPAVYHRYGRKQEWLAEWTMRFKNAWLHRHLLKLGLSPILGIEPINALVYGGWGIDEVLNPTMYQYWSNLTKTQVNTHGLKPYV